MADQIGYQVDLDEEKILFEDQWVGRKELAERIRQMIESQDYRISAAGAALEFLETSVSGARSLKVKLSGPDAEAVARHADRADIPVGKFLRQAVLAYLASQPPLDEAPGATEAAGGGAAGDVAAGDGAAAEEGAASGGEPPSPEASEAREAEPQPQMPPGLVPLGPAQPAGDAAAGQGAGESEAQPQGDGAAAEEEEKAPGPVLTTITTEPAGPEEASEAVELTSKKPVESSKVVVDPSLTPEDKPDPNAIGDSWFKKS